MNQKIPCSVGILTLNSGQALRRCLDSLKDFAEIIICDGNSTDNTLEIAREYGAKIVKQYGIFLWIRMIRYPRELRRKSET